MSRRVEPSRGATDDGIKKLDPRINVRAPAERVLVLALEGRCDGSQSSARCVRSRDIDSEDWGRARE